MRSDELDGWEINIQHMFGDSGFGFRLTTRWSIRA